MTANQEQAAPGNISLALRLLANTQIYEDMLGVGDNGLEYQTKEHSKLEGREEHGAEDETCQ